MNQFKVHAKFYSPAGYEFQTQKLAGNVCAFCSSALKKSLQNAHTWTPGRTRVLRVEEAATFFPTGAILPPFQTASAPDPVILECLFTSRRAIDEEVEIDGTERLSFRLAPFIFTSDLLIFIFSVLLPILLVAALLLLSFYLLYLFIYFQ
jgi:hypothetical protein